MNYPYGAPNRETVLVGRAEGFHIDAPKSVIEKHEPDPPLLNTLLRCANVERYDFTGWRRRVARKITRWLKS